MKVRSCGFYSIRRSINLIQMLQILWWKDFNFFNIRNNQKNVVYYLSKPKQPYISIHSPPSFLFDLFDFFDFLIYIIHKDVKMSITFLTSLTSKGISIKYLLISLCFKLIFRDIIDKIKYKKSIYTKSKKSRGDLNERNLYQIQAH